MKKYVEPTRLQPDIKEPAMSGNPKTSQPTGLPEWNRLQIKAAVMNRAENHLRHLLDDPDRFHDFSVYGGGLFYDFSKQRMDRETLQLLFDLADARDIQKKFSDMCSGVKVNITESRPALHTAARCFSDTPILVDGRDVLPEIKAVREAVRQFAEDVNTGKCVGSTGKPFRDIVVIGIGGSYLGADFVARALRAYTRKGMRLHFLSNVDIHNFGEIEAVIHPEQTLWIIISKSYTTAETMANAKLAYAHMTENNLAPEKHVVTVTSKGSPGDDPDNPVLASFHMFDYIGGRYSVTSAVGAAPLSLLFGYDRFEEMLKGAEEMDIHAASAPPEKNMPLIAALIGIWNNNFLMYPAQAIIPYASPLARLAPHVQQLYMESNGKSVDISGAFTEMDTGVIIFGEPGTNAQHSFFQLAHQGRPFPIEFIGVVNPQYRKSDVLSRGVTPHQELWANLISQPKALAMGRDADDKSRFFSGNRPSATILLNDLSPRNIGRLLSFYEARTVFEAFVWGINPFDQFGVELGKKLAGEIREQMADRNQNPDAIIDKGDAVSEAYLRKLFTGNI